MIFVTVGSMFFDELIVSVDQAVGAGLICKEVVMQIGHGGAYQPRYCEFFRSRPGLDLYYERAELVVGHGGTGTTLEVIEKGLRLISVCNPNLAGNHQNDFLEALEQRGFLRYCRDLADLPRIINKILMDEPPAAIDLSRFFRRIVNDLEIEKTQPNKPIRLIQSMLASFLRVIPPAKLRQSKT